MFNEFGTPIGVESESMLPPGSIKPHERLIAESGVEMNIGIGLGIAIGGAFSAAGSLFGQSSQRKAQRRQAQHQKAQADRAYNNQVAAETYRHEFQTRMIEHRNEIIEQEYDVRLEEYKEQLQFNNAAAGKSYAAEQFKLNEVFAKAAFARQGMTQELYRIQGEQLAKGSGRRSRSRDRAARINSLGEFGRSNWMQTRSLMSAQYASKQKIAGIARQHYQSNLNAYSKIRIPPRLEMPGLGAGPVLQSPVAALSVPGLGFGDIAATTFGAVGSGINTYASMGGFGTF